jgi:SpoVK/Ycf46/Vps4 family AAA+-type ATPase
LLDEADSFLQDRRHAVRSWEITMTNELLQQMEAFPGVFACTTNLFRNLDQASLRRFTFKIAFGCLRADQALSLFRHTLVDLRAGAAPGADGVTADGVAAELARMVNLTPGDFAAVARRLRALQEIPSPRRLLDELRAEVRVKEGPGAPLGF